MSLAPDYLDMERDHMLRRIAVWIAHSWREERDIQAVCDLICMRALQRRDAERQALHLSLEQAEHLMAAETAQRAADALARVRHAAQPRPNEQHPGAILGASGGCP